jgi:arylsulfatase A-like enzyme
MQSAAPAVVDFADETAETLEMYGIGEKDTDEFGRRCLLARRLAERGVRFVQLYSGDTNGWDAHNDVLANHGLYCRKTDKPVAGLLRDLRRRGLLDDTLVIWGGEFGRTPMGENRDTTGRNHHIDAFTMWFAGGGVKRGAIIGRTDELGFNAVEDRCHVHDFHATILHLLGLKHTQLTFRFQGRDFRLTDVHGEIIHKLLA